MFAGARKALARRRVFAPRFTQKEISKPLAVHAVDVRVDATESIIFAGKYFGEDNRSRGLVGSLFSIGQPSRFPPSNGRFQFVPTDSSALFLSVAVADVSTATLGFPSPVLPRSSLASGLVAKSL